MSFPYFFDLESAYDTTWKYGIMNDLHDFGIRGRLAYFISAFLNERQFRVRVEDTLSDLMNKKWVFSRDAFYLLLCLVLKQENHDGPISLT